MEALKRDARLSPVPRSVQKGSQQPETKEERAAVEKLLSPNPEDSLKYKAFLSKPDTGLFRLFSDFDCLRSKGVVRVDGDCANTMPGTWLYSFRQKNYSNDIVFDIRMKKETLFSGGFLSQGILVRLGDVPIENISLTSDGMKFLVDYKPELQNAEIKKQFLQIANGIESDGYKYAKNLAAAENTTYAMRVIAYRVEAEPDGLSAVDNMKIAAVNSDKRKDMILTFRIVRKEADGNVTILWKELARKDSPKIVFP